MSNVKTAISVLWIMFTFVIGAYYFVLTNDVQNLEKELAQINSDIRNDIRDIHILEADWSELNNPERLKSLAGKYISLDFIKPEQIINYSALPLEGELFENPTMFAKNKDSLRILANSER
ncbi:MAG: hypothetical protein IKW39_00875 [Alphaproteobacteria bacterium]|nr:hypothetical protein [Alphaproteobacteria bacterium]